MPLRWILTAALACACLGAAAAAGRWLASGEPSAPPVQGSLTYRLLEHS